MVPELRSELPCFWFPRTRRLNSSDAESVEALSVPVMVSPGATIETEFFLCNHPGTIDKTRLRLPVQRAPSCQRMRRSY
jgi:hypothetical protein